MRVIGAGFITSVVLGGLWACSSFTTTTADTTASDASTDTSAEAITPDAGPFCQSRPETLCVDFEINGFFGGDWASNKATSTGPSTARRDGTMGKDSLASLHSTLLAGTGIDDATLELGTETTSDHAYLEADFYVKHPSVSFGAELTVISLQRGPDGTATDVEAKIDWIDDGTYSIMLYAETGPNANGTASAAVAAFDTWVHVRLEADLEGTDTGSASIFVNGGPRTKVDVARHVVKADEHTRAVLGLARFTEATATGIDAFIDNVFSGALP